MSPQFWLFAAAAGCAGIDAFRSRSLVALGVALLAAGFAITVYHP